ncbi:MAG: rRNA maturation RNase YbeY [Paludibacteraceae bacterium]|nr:rRNA maturation RNase YbeY [Paludibacteraceae bacterium]
MIRFTTQDVDMPAFDQRRVQQWIRSVAADYGFTVGDITYVFTDDEGEMRVNQQFLGHDYYTDVITFDYSSQNVISGDIFISLDMIRHNAEQVGTIFVDELMRIMIHGVLHLTGQGDKTPESKAVMTEKENLALAKLT